MITTIDSPRREWSKLSTYGPGVALSVGVAALAMLVQALETMLIGQPVIEGLVVAILLGILIRTVWGVAPHLVPGVNFTAKQILEVAIVLLGVSVDLPSVLKAGPVLLLAVVLVVFLGILSSSLIGRLLGLNPRLAILVACGNSICGNSAIAAVAPVIGAESDDVASSIALTAVVGVIVVLLLPLMIPLVNLSFYQYGVLAGMTVYAVPQVLAATFPVSAISGQVGTLVKLVRVLMLGPVVLFFALRYPQPAGSRRLSVTRFVPWFILGFMLVALARSVGAVPLEFVQPLQDVSRWLTVAAMAALGLNVDITAVRKVGRPVALAVAGSLVVLIALGLGLIKGFAIVG